MFVTTVSQEPHARDPWCGGISRFDGHRRAILKVQDGCGFACAYCAVPPARGKAVSRPLKDILEEGRRLAQNGIHELVLAGVHLASYGRDLGKRLDEPRLAPVVENLLSLNGIRRVRLSSYGVADFEKGLLPLLKTGLCPHLHLPLQSGDPEILKAMRRPYRLEHFVEKVAWVRQLVPDAGITTDLIVGFPGEGEGAFENTLRMVETLDFLDFHLFPFSERPGTAAVELNPKVEKTVLQNRVERLRTLKKKRLEENAFRLSGKVVEVVAERYKKGLLGGTSDRGWKVAFPEGMQHPGEEVKLRLAGFDGDRSIGEVI
jgi:threonylcarbamoyladenosine tRNA methylthiotransferase MtaB